MAILNTVNQEIDKKSVFQPKEITKKEKQNQYDRKLFFTKNWIYFGK